MREARAASGHAAAAPPLYVLAAQDPPPKLGEIEMFI
jgi:hypothetical protein